MFLILLLCFLLVLFIFILGRYYWQNDNKGIPLPKQKIPSLESGDLVFVSYSNLFGKLVRCWSGSKWTHIGMVYKDEYTKEISILEMADYKNPNFDSGVIEVPYQDWLKLNEGREIVYKKLGKKINSEQLYISFERLASKRLLTFRPKTSYFKRFLFPYPKVENEEELTCTEFIAILLQDVGILSNLFSPSEYSAYDLLNLK